LPVPRPVWFKTGVLVTASYPGAMGAHRPFSDSDDMEGRFIGLCAGRSIIAIIFYGSGTRFLA